jgi:hypothetical protein
MVSDIPLALGNAFNQNTQLLAISMTSRGGILVKGSVLYNARIIYFSGFRGIRARSQKQ